MKVAACVVPVLACSQELQTIPGGVFAGGFLSGFFGQESEIAQCAQDGPEVLADIGSFVSDLKERNITAVVADVEKMVADAKKDLEDCRGAEQNVKDILDALKDIHSVQDMLKHVEADILKWDDKLLEELEAASKVCTFEDADGHECGRLIGAGIRQLIVGDSPAFALKSSKNKSAFVAGFLEGLIGNTDDISQCVNDAQNLEGDVAKAMTDIKEHKIEAAVADLEKLVTDVKGSLQDCEEIKGDLDPFTHILDNVTSASDLYKKIKQNALENDRAVLDQIEDMLDSCTFETPDATKCGSDMGTIVRLFTVGGDADVVV